MDYLEGRTIEEKLSQDGDFNLDSMKNFCATMANRIFAAMESRIP